MARVRRKQPQDRSRTIDVQQDNQQAMPLDDGTLTTPVTLAMIQALIPLVLLR